MASAQTIGGSSTTGGMSIPGITPTVPTGTTAPTIPNATGAGSSATRSGAQQGSSSTSGTGAQGSTSTGQANPLATATTGQPSVNQAMPQSQYNAPVVGVLLSDGVSLPVYGAQLFTGAFAGTRAVDRPDYLIQPGDQIAINLFGAVNNGSVQTVDAGGNVFIVGVGPVRVQGIPQSQLQATITAAVGRVFTSAVSVYSAVSNAGSIGVFVSGEVNRPGRFIGGAHDSVLYYLTSAGGIDGLRGSFRNVTVRRNGQVVAEFDLYDFLQSGNAPPFRFEDGDVVFVSPRGPLVGAGGAVRDSFAFEAPAHQKMMTGADLLRLAHPMSNVTGAVVHGYRNGSPRASYFTLEEFSRVVLEDGDHVDFSVSGVLQTVTVNIQGNVPGPQVYVLPNGATLSQLLAKLPLQGTNVEPRWVHIQRPAVAAEQTKLIQQELYNLQKQVLTSSPPTNSAAQLATAQATLVSQFVTQVQQIQPDGNVAVYSNGQFQDLELQDNDVVVLPDRSDVVIVSGEVLSPGAMAHVSNATIRQYIDRAGSFAAHANKKRFVLRHQDGSAVVAGQNDRPLPGDEIVVLPTVGNENLQVFMDLSTLFFQLALASATVISVSHNL